MRKSFWMVLEEGVEFEELLSPVSLGKWNCFCAGSYGAWDRWMLPEDAGVTADQMKLVEVPADTVIASSWREGSYRFL